MKPTLFLCLRFWQRAGRMWWSGPMAAVMRVLVLVVMAAGLGWAQPGSVGPGPAAPTAIPLDGGVSLLLAGGVGYAIRRLRRNRPS